MLRRILLLLLVFLGLGFLSFAQTSDSTQTESTQPVDSAKVYKYARPTGHYGLVEVGFGKGLGEETTIPAQTNPVRTARTVKNENDLYTFRVVNGYQINRLLGLGLVLGADMYNQNQFIPVGLDVRFSPLPTRLAPLVYGQVGYAYGLTENSARENVGGINYAAGLQVAYRLKKDGKESLTLGVGYNAQTLKLIDGAQESRRQTETTWGFWQVRLGIGF